MARPGLLIDLHTEPPIKGMRFALGKAAENVSDFEYLLRGFGRIFRQQMTEQFASEGSLAGGWHELSEKYDAWKQEHYPGRPIGVLTGALRSGMTGGAGSETRISSTEGSYGLGSGPAMVYGKHFAAGGRGPARPVIKWGTPQTREYQKFAHLWLHNALDVAAGH